MTKELTEKQKEQIDRLYRKAMWSIKRIAKYLHISDRRVSAYLKGYDTKPCAGCKPSGKKPTKGKKPDTFAEYVTVFTDGEPVKDFIAALHKLLLDDMLALTTGKTPSKAKVVKVLDEVFETFVEAATVIAICTMLEMPDSIKEKWCCKSSPKAAKKAGKGKSK